MTQNNKNIWTVVQMYCPNCGTLNYGYKDSDGRNHFECKKCTLIMVRAYKNRRHDTVEITIPPGVERLKA